MLQSDRLQYLLSVQWYTDSEYSSKPFGARMQTNYNENISLTCSQGLNHWYIDTKTISFTMHDNGFGPLLHQISHFRNGELS